MKFNTSFIRVCYLKPVFDGMEQIFGIGYQDLHIPEALMQEPMALIPFTQVGHWLTQLAELSQDPCYMVKLSEYLHFNRLEISGIDPLATPDVAMSIRRINYGVVSLHSGASYYVSQSAKIMKWCYKNPYVFKQQKSLDSLRVAITLLNAQRHFLGKDYRPIRVQLSGSAIGHEQVSKLFGSPVVWNAAQTEIWFDIEEMVHSVIPAQEFNAPVTLPRSLFEKYLNMPQPHDAPKVLFEMINYSRFYGLPKVKAVAKLFNISEQQLQRRLQHLGLTFSTISNYILSNQAIKYMLDGKEVEEIASLLGYANQQSFSRAFKRLRRCTPQQYLDKLNQQTIQK
ncbi:AraC family transcriptional regulator [Shewanella nanhaiensis]|uniref:AraC family transcriptional regulator n=1 Tax=Shewanella nanhaiensis TaxID=2864872 RepID=A0ABS7E6L5_9GAMM|nr:AraC family transcriptional regulator [Shewanella nanhaiensis]MBW8185321.1 AraC family transcriptional regulator [Shewanella nanhaiensis]